MKNKVLIIILVLALLLLSIVLYRGIGKPVVSLGGYPNGETSSSSNPGGGTGQSNGEQSGGNTGGSVSTPGGSSGGPNGGKSNPVASTIVITQSENGGKIYLPVGSNILLQLGEMDWDVSISDPGIINRVQNVAVARGAQGLYSADKVGVTTVSATGRPHCKIGEFCAQYIVSFYVTVIVEP